MDEKPRRGRPPKDGAKVGVSLRLPPDLLSAYKAKGSNWRALMEATLADALRPAAVVEAKPAPRPKSPPSAVDVVKAARPPKAAGGVDIPVFQRKAFNPQPKTGKTKR